MKTELKNRMRKLIFCGLLTGISIIFSGSVNLPVLAQSIDSQAKLTLKKVSVFGSFHKGYFSPDGTKMSLLGSAGVEIVNTSDGKRICHLDIASKPFLISAPFSPDGKMLAVGYSLYNPEYKTLNFKILLIETSTCKETKRLIDLEAKRGQYLSFSSDGQYLAAVANTPRVWEVKTGKEIYQASIPENYFTQSTLLSPSGKWLASYASIFKAPYTYGTFVVSDLQTKQQKELSQDLIKAFKFSADSTLLVTANTVIGESGFGESVKVKVYEVGSWKVIQEFEVAGGFNNTLDISGDKQLLAIGGFGTFKIFSLKTGKLLAEQYHYKRSRKADLAGAPDLISILDYIEFSPDGSLLLIGGEDGTVKLWKSDNPSFRF